MTTDASLLVVDDDEVNRLMLQAYLVREGHTVTLAGSGADALEILERGSFDALLLDVLMPGLDGFEVLERLRDDDRLRRLPVIMISAIEDTDSVVRCIEMGAEDYLAKPFDPVLLRARINGCLAKRRLDDLEEEHRRTLRTHAAELQELNRHLTSRVEEQLAELERMGQLRNFFSPHVAELILTSGGDGLADHRGEIAVVSCRLRGFPSLSETAAPEVVMGVLRQFHATLGGFVRRFEATVGDFTGDGVMLYFNDPVPCPDPAAQAVRLAVALRDELVALQSSWRKQDCQVDFGCGISQGYATFGQVGFEGHYHYGPIGAVVPVAARLCERAAGAADVLIDQMAYSAVEDLVEVEPLGEFELEGFSRPRPAYRVLALNGRA
jgi:adenylate cyclase